MKHGKQPKLLASLIPVLCLHAGACLVAFAAVRASVNVSGDASGTKQFSVPQLEPTQKFEHQHVERRARTASRSSDSVLPASFQLNARPVANLQDPVDLY